MHQRLLERLMTVAPEFVVLRQNVSPPLESHLGGIVDLRAPGSWSEIHTAEVVPVEAL